MPIAQRLVLQPGYLQHHLSPEQLRTYYKGMTRLGGALNALPQDFLVGVGQGREESIQSEIRGAISDLKPVLATLPGAHTYLKQLDDLHNATTVERVGTGVNLASKGELTR